jgi:hypothetical protein
MARRAGRRDARWAAAIIATIPRDLDVESSGIAPELGPAPRLVPAVADIRLVCDLDGVAADPHVRLRVVLGVDREDAARAAAPAGPSTEVSQALAASISAVSICNAKPPGCFADQLAAT